MTNIRKVLDLSTSHLPADLGQALTGEESVVAHEMTYGYIMWVPESPDDHSDAHTEHVRDELLVIQRYARGRGCDYVLFDRDGPVDDDLPTFDW